MLNLNLIQNGRRQDIMFIYLPPVLLFPPHPSVVAVPPKCKVGSVTDGHTGQPTSCRLGKRDQDPHE